MEVQLSSGENVPLPVLKRLSDKHLTLNVLFFFFYLEQMKALRKSIQFQRWDWGGGFRHLHIRLDLRSMCEKLSFVIPPFSFQHKCHSKVEVTLVY